MFSNSVSSKIYFIASITYKSVIYTRKQKKHRFMLSVVLEKPKGKSFLTGKKKKTERKEFLIQNL